MPFTEPPPLPVRGDRATFPLAADLFLAWLVDDFFVELIAAAETFDEQEAAAIAAANTATGASDNAQSVVGIEMWNGATNYATGDAAISPTDYQAYRRESPGGVDATDPAASGVWTAIHGDKLQRSGDTATNLTVDGLTIDGAVVEEVFAISGTTPAISAANGSIQTWTLSANSSPTYSLNAGESVTLMIDDGSAYVVTWPTTRWVGSNGTAPVLSTTGYNVITLWRVGADVFGSFGGAG